MWTLTSTNTTTNLRVFFVGPIVVEESQHGLFRATTQSASVAEMSALFAMILSFVRHVYLGEGGMLFPLIVVS